MDTAVRKLPKKRKFDPSELEEPDPSALGVPVSVVQTPPQAAAVDYSVRIDDTNTRRHSTIDLGEWRDTRVLAKQGDWYHPGVIRDACGSDVSTCHIYLLPGTKINH